MKPGVILRILRDRYAAEGMRRAYWRAGRLLDEARTLFSDRNADFRRHVLRNQLRFISDTTPPIAGETRQRAQAAVQWLLLAKSASADGGVSLGYFPCTMDSSPWKPSYPETTGYIISSLLEYAERFSDDVVRSAALGMAEWEATIQMASGAVQGGPVCAAEQQRAAAFNTGMVLDGWCSAYSATNDDTLLAPARRAADFLVNDMDDDGYFRTNGPFVTAGEIKTYTCLCAWSIYRFGLLADEPRHVNAAIRAVEAALRQQQPNGWFAHNCLVRSDAPLTHTIGYTLQGVLEVGLLAGREDFIAAVRRTVDALMPLISSRGYLPGTFYSDWEPAGFSSCLTGSAQIAVVCYRLYQSGGRREYLEAGNRLVDFLKTLQTLDSPCEAVNGGLPGSFPLFGEYMRAGYPNWATKYLLDALLLQHSLKQPSHTAGHLDAATAMSRVTQ